MGRVHNAGRVSVRRGRVAKIDGLDVYINGMFRGDENGLKEYESNQSARAGQAAMALDVKTHIREAIHAMLEDGRDAAREFALEFEQFGEDVREATPYHVDGPTDPPWHAADAWKFGFYPNGKGGFTATLYNPKDYMPFLEAGWSPQAPAGWLDALWSYFVSRLK